MAGADRLIDPAVMPLTRLANSIIDGVADQPREVRDEIVKYLGSDLLFYRADGPEGLTERQAARLGSGGGMGGEGARRAVHSG